MIACSDRSNNGAIAVHGEVLAITIAFPDITNLLPGQ